MSGPRSLPEGNKPASDVPFPFLNPVKPEHKGFSLCWMWFAEQATKDINDTAILSLFKSYSLIIARGLLKMQYQLDVTVEAIQTYYDQARKNAELANIEWDEYAVAMVMRSQGSDPVTYDEFKSLLDRYDMEVSLKAGSSFLFGGGFLQV